MSALDAKNISDEVNQVDEDKIDADCGHIEIEILEAAKKGSYSLDYTFEAGNKNFGEINAFRNLLISKGYEVEIKLSGNIYTLAIDWSYEKL